MYIPSVQLSNRDYRWCALTSVGPIMHLSLSLVLRCTVGKRLAQVSLRPILIAVSQPLSRGRASRSFACKRVPSAQIRCLARRQSSRHQPMLTNRPLTRSKVLVLREPEHVGEFREVEIKEEQSLRGR
jgi:hypothetical protein